MIKITLNEERNIQIRKFTNFLAYKVRDFKKTDFESVSLDNPQKDDWRLKKGLNYGNK